MSTPKEVLAQAKKDGVVMVDLRFTDWPGTWQHCSFPLEFVDEATFEDGMGFDGSSIRGWQAINESDMLMIPDATTAFIDPFFEHPTLVNGVWRIANGGCKVIAHLYTARFTC